MGGFSQLRLTVFIGDTHDEGHSNSNSVLAVLHSRSHLKDVKHKAQLGACYIEIVRDRADTQQAP